MIPKPTRWWSLINEFYSSCSKGFLKLSWRTTRYLKFVQSVFLWTLMKEQTPRHYRPRYCSTMLLHERRRMTAWHVNDNVSSSTYRVGPKMAQFMLNNLTLSNINRFSKFFHCQNQEKICNNIITKDPTTPQVCRYTTLWNVRVLYISNNWKQDDFCNNTF